jgi:cytochrome c oxidase subunit 4
MAGHHVNYFMIFISLCVLTAMSVIFDVVEFNSRILLVVLVLAVATAKALFVMTYLMHLKFERNWKYLLLLPTGILAMGLPLALMPDIGVHYYTVDTLQAAEARPGAAPHATEESGASADEGHH